MESQSVYLFLIPAAKCAFFITKVSSLVWRRCFWRNTALHKLSGQVKHLSWIKKINYEFWSPQEGGAPFDRFATGQDKSSSTTDNTATALFHHNFFFLFIIP